MKKKLFKELEIYTSDDLNDWNPRHVHKMTKKRMVEYILWKIEFENYTLKFRTSCTLKLEDGSWMNN